MIKGVLTYLEQNIRDPIYKMILMNVYLKYGPAYMLSVLTEPHKVGNNDFDVDAYYPALVKDVEYKPNELTIYHLIDTIPAGRFSSLNFYVDYAGDPDLFICIFKFVGASSQLEFHPNSIKYGNAYISTYGSFSQPNVSVQVNIGWNHDNEMIVEWYVNGEHQQILNMNQVFVLYDGNNITALQNQCDYQLMCNNLTINFFCPNKVFASSTFLNSIL